MSGLGGMGWVRAKIGWGARLALIALALQFALSFGHVHALDVPAQAIERAASAIGPDAPDTDHHHNAAADLCAICAVVSMAQTALDAAPPALPPRRAAPLHYRIAAVAAADPSPQPGGFQPRAPPAA
ncbi:conserved hypothetical protein [Rhodopseudomonas palustris HaA2]|uniref:DUF2946 domain-containing protein n=1 Tax=Rhodopseudomonas palustris (strain HaA2) TaxID=316058 RepID=Q2ISC7_RHOP2|nr:hypothetical protein [Rhodopseudomonas palustris]ABD08883.1 conserved hypothetical protein [Rhodopseudomonas palustris HaA2]